MEEGEGLSVHPESGVDGTQVLLERGYRGCPENDVLCLVDRVDVSHARQLPLGARYQPGSGDRDSRPELVEVCCTLHEEGANAVAIGLQVGVYLVWGGKCQLDGLVGLAHGVVDGSQTAPRGSAGAKGIQAFVVFLSEDQEVVCHHRCPGLGVNVG